ncbi:MAG: hypothetical protein AB7O62_04895 [Pirellulales bacterium]
MRQVRIVRRQGSLHAEGRVGFDQRRVINRGGGVRAGGSIRAGLQ